MLDNPPRSDITTSPKRPSAAAQAQGFFAAALQGLSAIYASAAKGMVETFEDLADRRAELRAERLARGPERGVVVSRKLSRPAKARQSIVSAAKRAPKSR